MEHVIIAQLRAAAEGVDLLASLVSQLDQEQPLNRHAPRVASSVGATLAAAIALLEAWGDGPAAGLEDEQPATQEDGICRHPKERRRSTATAGRPNAWMCLACGFEHNGESANG